MQSSEFEGYSWPFQVKSKCAESSMQKPPYSRLLVLLEFPTFAGSDITMIKILGRDKEYTLESTDGQDTIDGQALELDLTDAGNGSFHVIENHRSYNLEVVKADYESKTFEIRVNQQLYTLTAKDQFDELLEKLGMDSLSANVAEDFKAPMPGLVLDILVQPGQTIQKGEAMLVLEAMKMENSIKAPNDGVVKSIEAEKGQAVEKNQVLITFE